MIKIDTRIGEEIEKACATLNNGGIIVYPTDTVWGIGCDATVEAAVARIYEIKRRQDRKSMLVLVDSADCLDRYTVNVPDIARELAETAVEPLTIVYPGARNLAENLIPEDGSIGIRITREVFSRGLCRRFGKPIVSTSANFSGEPAPAFFSEINPEIIRLIDYTVDYRREETDRRRPSSIIGFDSGGRIRIIRK
jgi:L-threonylcarbamoyladenylate synthase